MPLTPSQEKALSTERHLAILANAGSGKTSVLVERYIRLFEQYPELSTKNVVAITFTENAANELRSRILAGVRARLKDTTDPEKRSRLRRLRESLPNAFIGTIHGFASRILRAYPVEANIDAAFAIITGADQQLMLEDAIGIVMYSELESAYETNDAKVLSPFRKLGRREITELVRALLRNRARTERIKRDLLSKTDAEINARWQADYEHACELALSDDTKYLFSDALQYVTPSKKGDPPRTHIPYYLAGHPAFATIGAFRRAAESILTGKCQLRKIFDVDQMPEELLLGLLQFERDYKAVRPLLELLPETEEQFQAVHKEYLDLQRAVLELYDKILAEYESTKAEYGLLDFDDLIFKLQKLLEQSEVREELTRTFRFVMIDEYQDTDESQLDLARALTRNFGSENNLAVVGDPKQTIYAFRNADAEIFRETLEAIESQALSEAALQESARMSLSEEDERGSIHLSESFRMTRAPLAAINHLFRHVMAGGGSMIGSEAIEYADLVYGRSAGLDGRVEWICPDAPATRKDEQEEDEASPGEQEEEDAAESELIARKLKSISRDPSYEVEGKDGVRSARLSDIAILLRSRSLLPQLERALRAEGIPYTVAKGAGFFAQQEILDITSYLSFLLSPSDNIHLAAILRSPFFALSDVEMYQIARHHAEKRRALLQPWSFWDQFRDYAASSGSEHLKRAVDQLSANLLIAGRTGTAFLVEKIYAETGIFATLMAGPQGVQKIANLDKFLGLARSSDSSGFSSMFDFVDRIRYLIETKEQESQADSTNDDSGGAVQIHTVHAAKGLEFKIVILPYLQKGFNLDHSRNLDKQLGLQVTLPDQKRKWPIGELIRLRAEARSIAEEKRILYVATTRARDHLILSYTLPPSPKSNSWLAWVLDAFAPPQFESSFRLDGKIQRYDGETRLVSGENISLNIPLIRKLSDIEVLPAPEEQATDEEVLEDHCFTIPSKVSTSRFSATQFIQFRECPTKYHLAYGLGLREDRTVIRPEEVQRRKSIEPSVPATQFGTIVHRMFDRISEMAPSAQLNDAAFESHLRNVLSSLSGPKLDPRSFAPKVRTHIASFLASPVASEALAATAARTEFALQTMLPSGDMLYGVIDRLYKDASGTWTILDYKTTATSDRERHEQNKERYALQMRFYAYLVKLFDPTADKIRAIVFFTESGEAVEYCYGPAELDRLSAKWESMIDEIHRMETTTDLLLLPRNESHCKECGFYDNDRKACMVVASSLKAD